MKLKFTGGPWDGVEFETSFAPDHIRFWSLVEEHSLADKLGVPENDPDDPDFDHPLRAVLDDPIEVQERGHIAYERETETGDVPVVEYKFSPGALPWWQVTE